jgi:hypothetical protein
MVETEYIGKRRDFKNSYFASLRQILNGFGRCTVTIELTMVEAAAILISLTWPWHPERAVEEL